jgi:hypothetical protein
MVFILFSEPSNHLKLFIQFKYDSDKIGRIRKYIDTFNMNSETKSEVIHELEHLAEKEEKYKFIKSFNFMDKLPVYL